jgi:hypothetical protein
MPYHAAAENPVWSVFRASAAARYASEIDVRLSQTSPSHARMSQPAATAATVNAATTTDAAISHRQRTPGSGAGSLLARRAFRQPRARRANELGAGSGLQEHIRLPPSPVSGSPPAPPAFGGDPPGEHAFADPGIHHQHRDGCRDDCGGERIGRVHLGASSSRWRQASSSGSSRGVRTCACPSRPRRAARARTRSSSRR